MKKISLSFLMFLFATACPLLIAQQPTAVGGKGVATGHPQTPPATGPMLNLANHLVDAINKQDTTTLQKMLASDAVYLDEDGHAPPARVWIHKLATGTPAKQIAISATHSQMWDDAGWVSFNYTLAESLQGQPKTVEGTASIVVKKTASGDWQIQLIHGALKQKVAGLTQ
jgi:ketosteroid isomerase-like protein